MLIGALVATIASLVAGTATASSSVAANFVGDWKRQIPGMPYITEFDLEEEDRQRELDKEIRNILEEIIKKEEGKEKVRVSNGITLLPVEDKLSLDEKDSTISMSSDRTSVLDVVTLNSGTGNGGVKFLEEKEEVVELRSKPKKTEISVSSVNKDTEENLEVSVKEESKKQEDEVSTVDWEIRYEIPDKFKRRDWRITSWNTWRN